MTLNGTLTGSSTIVAGTSIYSTNIVSNGANVDMSAGNLVELNPGFDARTGSVYEAYIGGCSPFNISPNLPAPSNTLLLEVPVKN